MIHQRLCMVRCIRRTVRMYNFSNKDSFLFKKNECSSDFMRESAFYYINIIYFLFFAIDGIFVRHIFYQKASNSLYLSLSLFVL